MSTSNKRWERQCAKRYLWAALFSAIFAAVYEAFSHGVYSAHMILMFLWPLLGGALPFWLLSRRARPLNAGWLSRCLYHSGIATLTLGSCMTGVFELYGTSSAYVMAYWGVGGVLVLAGAVWGWCGRFLN